MVYYEREEVWGHGLVLTLVPTSLQNAVTKSQENKTIKNRSNARNHCINGMIDTKYKSLADFFTEF